MPQMKSYAQLSDMTHGFPENDTLGKGGGGTVWAGTMDGKPVAVKRTEIDQSMLVELGLGLEAAKNQFDTELFNMIGLKHRNIISVLAFNTYHDGCGYIVMPKMDCDLKRFVPTATTGRELLGVLFGALEGLKYVHENGHCHCDLNMQNIFVSQGMGILGDLGLTLKVGEAGSGRTNIGRQRTAFGTGVGHIGYICPKYQDTGDFSWHSDMYPIGVIFLQALMGNASSPPNSNEIIDGCELGMMTIVDYCNFQSSDHGTQAAAKDIANGALEWDESTADALLRLGLQCTQHGYGRIDGEWCHKETRRPSAQECIARLELPSHTEAEAAEAEEQQSEGAEELMSEAQLSLEPDLPPPEVGETVVYTRTDESATVLQVHRADPTEVYVTIEMPDGREKQTTVRHLKRQQRVLGATAARQSYPANYTQWKDADIQALKAKVLRNDTRTLSEQGGLRLIKAMFYKAVHFIEAGEGAADAFDTTDSSCCYTTMFSMCTQNKSMEKKLYKFHKELWTEYLTDVVMPAIVAHPAEFSRCLVQVFEMVRLFKRFSFSTVLDRRYISIKNLPTTYDVEIAKILDVFLAFKPAPAGVNPKLWLMFCAFDADGDARVTSSEWDKGFKGKRKQGYFALLELFAGFPTSSSWRNGMTGEINDRGGSVSLGELVDLIGRNPPTH